MAIVSRPQILWRHFTLYIRNVTRLSVDVSVRDSHQLSQMDPRDALPRTLLYTNADAQCDKLSKVEHVALLEWDSWGSRKPQAELERLIFRCFDLVWICCRPTTFRRTNIVYMDLHSTSSRWLHDVTANRSTTTEVWLSIIEYDFTCTGFLRSVFRPVFMVGWLFLISTSFSVWFYCIFKRFSGRLSVQNLGLVAQSDKCRWF